jgi:hypothetical protein
VVIKKYARESIATACNGDRAQGGTFVTSTNPRSASRLLILHVQLPRAESLKLASQILAVAVSQSLVAGTGVAWASNHLRRSVSALMLMLLLLRLLLLLLRCHLHSLDLLRLVSARGRRKAAADLGGNDAPTIVLVLLHGIAKLYHLFCRLWLACLRLWLQCTTSCVS